MTGLRDVLVEVAEDAREYDVTDRAVRVVRRRQLATRLVPVAAALLVVAGLVAVAVPFGRGAEPESPPGAAGLPGRIVPEQSPPLLPEDRGVGRATLAYLNGDTSAWAVLTADGHQYRVDGLQVQAISADGRWLVTLRTDQTRVLRDLAGTGRQELPPGEGAHFSPDSGKLVVPARSGSATIVDLATAARTTVPLDPAPPNRVCAIRNSGNLVLCQAPGSPFNGLRLADGATGHIARDIADLGLPRGETVPAESGSVTLGPDDRTVYLTATQGEHRSLVGYDLGEGRLTVRYPLPDKGPAAERPGANGGVEYGPPDERYLLGIDADGPLLLHLAPSRSDPFSVGTAAIEVIARDTGALTTVTLLARPIRLAVYPG
ncbi:hypothetical protein GCM10018962_82810 [Dactylosporangium matsuzakiense]|uniref:Uncharacterized protein n=1 Tax=Dactylosporangium matsuzakiense TaxID=53360 RepID=A0A9W6KBA0_9ACTN|nr:hypothetical protein GCM10017581_000980 [Dactylosporangium matsuzakiense]